MKLRRCDNCELPCPLRLSGRRCAYQKRALKLRLLAATVTVLWWSLVISTAALAITNVR